MEVQIQKLRLSVNGAVCLYEGQGPGIPAVLAAHVAALYRMQEEFSVRG